MVFIERKSEGIALLGRVLLATIFVVSGLAKIPGWSDSVQYMAAQGIPAPALFLGFATALELVCGISILFGWRARLGAGLLFLYLIPVTLIFHAFWNFEGMDRQLQMVNFLKNLSIMGGLALLTASGPGAYSMDAKRELKNVTPLRPGDRIRAA